MICSFLSVMGRMTVTQQISDDECTDCIFCMTAFSRSFQGVILAAIYSAFAPAANFG